MTIYGLTMKERFWRKVDKRGDDECWNWTIPISGYGHNRIVEPNNGKYVPIHEYSYELHKGPILEGMRVCQKCNNKNCVNPRHLLLEKQISPMESRFWKYVEKKDGDDCWYWIGSCNKQGYGRIRESNQGRLLLAHRYSYELVHGPITEDMFILHKCNHPPCVNPNHLEIGDQYHNMGYASELGRLSGEIQGGSKLTIDQVREIRKMLNDGDKEKFIAEHFAISITTVYDIKTGRTWNHPTVQ